MNIQTTIDEFDVLPFHDCSTPTFDALGDWASIEVDHVLYTEDFIITCLEPGVYDIDTYEE